MSIENKGRAWSLRVPGMVWKTRQRLLETASQV